MNLRNLSYRQKNRLLWVVLILGVLFVYKRNITFTIHLYKECNELQQKTVQAEYADVKIKALRAELKSINRNSGNPDITPEEVQQDILDRSAALSSRGNLLLASFRETHEAVAQGYKVTTHVIEIEGGFVSSLRFIHDFERNYHDARLVSVKFYTRENYKTHKKHLYGSLFFRQVRKV